MVRYALVWCVCLIPSHRGRLWRYPFVDEYWSVLACCALPFVPWHCHRLKVCQFAGKGSVYCTLVLSSSRSTTSSSLSRSPPLRLSHASLARRGLQAAPPLPNDALLSALTHTSPPSSEAYSCCSLPFSRHHKIEIPANCGSHQPQATCRGRETHTTLMQHTCERKKSSQPASLCSSKCARETSSSGPCPVVSVVIRSAQSRQTENNVVVSLQCDCSFSLSPLKESTAQARAGRATLFVGALQTSTCCCAQLRSCAFFCPSPYVTKAGGNILTGPRWDACRYLALVRFSPFILASDERSHAIVAPRAVVFQPAFGPPSPLPSVLLFVVCQVDHRGHGSSAVTSIPFLPTVADLPGPWRSASSVAVLMFPR